MRKIVARIFSIEVFLIAMAVALGACSHSGAQFSTTLSAPDGLRSGDPVTQAGSRIGEVGSLSSAGSGGRNVNFEVYRDDLNLVHTDSIAILKEPGGSPELELNNPNPGSPVAPAGSQLIGASSDAEADAIRMGRRVGSNL